MLKRTPEGRPETQQDAGPARTSLQWHAISSADALRALEAGATGLSAAEARVRLARNGPNALPSAPSRSILQRLIAQFDNLLIYVLLGSALITALLGKITDTAVILGVVFINALIGMVQEGRAERALDAIRNMISPKAAVLRDGRRIAVPAAEIVQGDIVLLEPGDRVAADLRLVRARNLRIDEAILTGESVPVEKDLEATTAGAAIADRLSMAFSGTLVTAGIGSGVVVATGPATELGRLSALLGSVEQLETPLIRQVNILARQLTIAILALAAATFGFAVFVRQYPIADAFLAVVAMAVAAIPEGLPAVMTITLAVGVQRMAQRNAIIRRLPAVETLGAVSVICSDKTGTLTRNEMTVTSVVLANASLDVSGVGYAPHGGFSREGQEIDPLGEPCLIQITRSALLCNDATLQHSVSQWSVIGDPMEGALVALALKTGHDQDKLTKRYPRQDEIPFEAADRYMATLHHDHETGASFVCVKGAPERILEMCSAAAAARGDETIDQPYWHAAVDRLAADGHRVLAIATRTLSPHTHELIRADVEHDLTLQGVLGLIDPPRPEAAAAIAECRRAGIAVKMITGDHQSTARAIATQLGLQDPQSAMVGSSLDHMDETELGEVARPTSVFARTSPEQKLRLVNALQATGAIVAMTGDGVNDAPALKRADVGVAMGRYGTEAAKEAADMVLADDNFASIVAAVREGRTVYDNLTKVIAWTLPTSIGETLIIVAAILFGLTLPITPIQILWINMVTAVTLGLVLAFEPPEADVMSRPPRDPNAPFLTGFLLWRTLLVSVLFALGSFALFAFARNRGAGADEARTLAVNTIVVFEVVYLFSVRYLRTTSLTWEGVHGTPAVLVGLAAITILQVLFTYLPAMNALFHTAPLAMEYGVAVIGAGIALFVILEAEKHLTRSVVAWRCRRT